MAAQAKKVKKTLKANWFPFLQENSYMWDRIDNNTVWALVPVEIYFQYNDAINALGGTIIGQNRDRVNTHMYNLKIREPKNLV